MVSKIDTNLRPIWHPPGEIRPTEMDHYRAHINRKLHRNLKSTRELQEWSINFPQAFWLDLHNYIGLTPPLPKSMVRAYDASLPMSAVPVFFEGHRINYAENVLLHAKTIPNATALIGIREESVAGGLEDVEKVSWKELWERVRVVRSALKRSGIKEGERVAALVAMSVNAVVLFLATASLGAVYTSISPDLGLEGCVSRLQQVTPSILFGDSDASYKGKNTSVIPKIEKILERLEQKPKTFIIPIRNTVPSNWPSMSDFLTSASPTDKLKFTRVPFNAPLMICYSSGTTGAPKCIVHQHGLLLQSKKTSLLHNSLGPKDVVMQFTSTSWVVFYVMTGHLATGATCICYDGSPLYPGPQFLIKMLEKFKVTFFGSSPRYLLELEMSGTVPRRDFDISNLRMVYTTGAPLSADQYRWFYASFPPRAFLCNSAGGTDTATTLIGADQTSPLYPGEMQVQTLGTDLDILDPISGESIKHTGAAGEMVVKQPFPSMPCFFWGDDDQQSLYMSSYFQRFDNVDVWAQHDWLAQNPVTKGYIMSGRSDSVLNPSGIRFGSGEIYAIAEGPHFQSEIAETLCVGRRRPQDTDEQVFLFVRMAPGKGFSDNLVRRLRDSVRAGLSARHVPKFIFEVKGIPVTVNGKKVEIAVKQFISGKDVVTSSTVINPNVLQDYRRFRDVEARETKL